MSQTEPEPSCAASLDDLRAALDGIDDGLHDLLMQRAVLVQQVAAAKANGSTPGRLRPGREAAIVRRLLARHHGSLPAASVLRVWRELLAGSVAMQGPFAVAVCDPDPALPTLQSAREQFGALTPMLVHASPLHALGEVSRGAAAVAVLPVPREDEPRRAAWWLALLHRDEPRIHVVARLPFWTARPDHTPNVQSYAVAAMPPDPSGPGPDADRSLVGLELPETMSRARLAAALAEAGFDPGAILLRREDGAAQALADLPGFITDDDPRLAALRAPTHRPVVLGAYACPIQS